ncbi:cytochrome c5 family protein [Spongiibacter sp.]|uniref:c-type cytochrome n=1 Tax=Spongiibacter sp. TaxID=2024860 RepID=UPI003567B64C
MRVLGLGFTALTVLALAACSGDKMADEAMAPATVTATSAASIDDPVLRRTYQSSCMACHGNPGSGAPLSGDRQAWASRLDKGMETLLDHSIDGFNSMPPMGLCPQCSEDDFVALIEWMAGVNGE